MTAAGITNRPIDDLQLLMTGLAERIADREYAEGLLLNTIASPLTRGTVARIDMVNKIAGRPFKIAANAAQSSSGYSVLALQDIPINTVGRVLLRGRAEAVAGEIVAAGIPMLANLNATGGLLIAATTGKKPIFLPEATTAVAVLGVGFFDGFSGVGLGATPSVTVSVDIANMAAGGLAGSTVDTAVAAAGFTTTDVVGCVPPTTLEAGVNFCAFCAVADTITLRTANTTNAGINPAAANWTFKRL